MFSSKYLVSHDFKRIIKQKELFRKMRLNESAFCRTNKLTSACLGLQLLNLFKGR